MNNTLPKQIKEQEIKIDTNNSEAFLYIFTNLDTDEKYIGIHKGKPFDGYMFSSKNVKFLEDFMNPNARFRYEVTQYGTYEYMGAVEKQKLNLVNAKDNPMYYNKSNGGSSIELPRISLLKSIVEAIQNEKEYKGATVVYTPVKDLPLNRLQIREFTKQPFHVKRLKDKINERKSLDHLLVVILKDRLYRGQQGDLIPDGNHSIEAAEESYFGSQGQIPTISLPEYLHKDLSDQEVDILALMFNPREKNPKLESSHEDIARQVCNLKFQGLETSSKEVQDLYHFFDLTKSDKSKVSKIAKQMYEEQNPSHTTWINYGAGDEKKSVQHQIKKECVTELNNTGIFSKCYSTSKYNAWSDIYDMMLWNKENPNNKIKTYKVRFYHTNQDYKDTWKQKWQSNNEYVIDEVLSKHKIKRDWEYLPEQRSKVTLAKYKKM